MVPEVCPVRDDESTLIKQSKQFQFWSKCFLVEFDSIDYQWNVIVQHKAEYLQLQIFFFKLTNSCYFKDTYIPHMIKTQNPHSQEEIVALDERFVSKPM